MVLPECSEMGLSRRIQDRGYELQSGCAESGQLRNCANRAVLWLVGVTPTPAGTDVGTGEVDSYRCERGGCQRVESTLLKAIRMETPMKTTLCNYSRISIYGVLALLLSSGPAGGQSFSVTNISVPGAASLAVS